MAVFIVSFLLLVVVQLLAGSAQPLLGLDSLGVEDFATLSCDTILKGLQLSIGYSGGEDRSDLGVGKASRFACQLVDDQGFHRFVPFVGGCSTVSWVSPAIARVSRFSRVVGFRCYRPAA